MSHHVLVVEDDWFLADILAAGLRQQGLHVQTAGTVADALAGALAEPPDLLMLDLRLPDGDGWTVLTQIRLMQTDRRIPVVVVSTNPVSRRLLREFGIEAFIAKPFRVQDLWDRVNALLATA